jgi:orotate phosphoribosyltransferase
MVRARLLDLLVRHAYRYDPAAPFRLTSGKQSDVYIDCKAVTMRGDAMDLVGESFAERLPPEVRAIGGLTMGADSIANAIASYASRHGRPLDAFSVRKEAKKHGLGRFIEGPVEARTKVAVVDDVITTGGSTIEAIRRCRAEGLEVLAVVVLVDRQEAGGLQAIQAEAGPAVPVVPLFTREEIHAHWLRGTLAARS